MRTRSVLLAALALSGCVTGRTMAELTAADAARVTRFDGYYLGKAKEQAAFALNCPAPSINVTVISTTPHGMYDEDTGGTLYVRDVPRAASIGAEGCGQRTTYQVLCGPNERYEMLQVPCSVLPSNEAVRVAQENNEDQEQLNRAAAAAQEQQPKK